MNDKFIVQDVTDIMVIGGFGNLKGNLELLKYSKEEIREMIKENNDENDNIRLVNSLIQSLKELKEQLQQKDDIINNILDYIDSNKFVEQFENVANERNVRNEILSKIERSDN